MGVFEFCCVVVFEKMLSVIFFNFIWNIKINVYSVNNFVRYVIFFKNRLIGIRGYKSFIYWSNMEFFRIIKEIKICVIEK